MAVDVCSEIPSLVTSPRISFSYDLNQTDVECQCRRSDALLTDFTTDFDFCISNNNNFLHQTSSADELFSNGKIIPTQIKKANTTTSPSEKETQLPAPTHSAALNEETKLKKLKEFLYEEEKPIASKSFWQFKRSTSLNYDNGRSKGFIRTLQTLARSNSTGSAPNSKQTVVPKVSTTQKQHHTQKQASSSSSNNQSLPSFSKYNQIYNSSGRPPLLKKCRSYSSGVRYNPVLNIPAACVSKGTANLFGFGSFFCSGKSKKKKK